MSMGPEELLEAAILVVVGVVVGRVLLALWRALARPSPPRPPPATTTDAYERIERPAMPPELRTARLVLNERLIKTITRPTMGARLDQLFELADGNLVLVETKTRRYARVRRSDQVQLTVQRYILLRAGIRALAGKYIAPYAYIRCAAPGQPPKYLRTNLLIDDVPEELYERRQALAAGAVPWVSDNPARCTRCQVRDRCPVWAARGHKPLTAWWTPAQRAWLHLTRGWQDTSPLLGPREVLPGQPRPTQARKG